MTDTITSQNIDLSSWDILYVVRRGLHLRDSQIKYKLNLN